MHKLIKVEMPINMKRYVTFTNTIIALIAVFFCAASFSETAFPSADGDDADVSPANIEGTLVEVTPSAVVVLKKEVAEKAKVILTERTNYFTAFGGLIAPDDLRIGQLVWVWYEDCDSSSNEIPKAKVVKIYSLDPNDKP